VELRCRIGAMSLLNVTSSGLKAGSEVEAKVCAPSANGAMKRSVAGRIRIRPIVSFHPKFNLQRITFTPIAGDRLGHREKTPRRPNNS